MSDNRMWIVIAAVSAIAIIWLLIDMFGSNTQTGSMWFSLALWIVALVGALYRLAGGRGLRDT